MVRAAVIARLFMWKAISFASVVIPRPLPARRCNVRAMWKGVIELSKHPVSVKMYSAVEDRSIHFKMLRKKGQAKKKAKIKEKIAAAKTNKKK